MFSLGSWAIIIYKGLVLHRAHVQSAMFLDVFRAQQVLRGQRGLLAAQGEPAGRRLPGRLRRGQQQVRKTGGNPTVPASAADRGNHLPHRAGSGPCSGRPAVELAGGGPAARLPGHHRPDAFIGLFGTVWGIMNAFREIGRPGSANLAIVAPGISEALITTAAGLLAAIPAAVFFNVFGSGQGPLGHDG